VGDKKFRWWDRWDQRGEAVEAERYNGIVLLELPTADLHCVPVQISINRT